MLWKQTVTSHLTKLMKPYEKFTRYWTDITVIGSSWLRYWIVFNTVVHQLRIASFINIVLFIFCVRFLLSACNVLEYVSRNCVFLSDSIFHLDLCRIFANVQRTTSMLFVVSFCSPNSKNSMSRHAIICTRKTQCFICGDI